MNANGHPYISEMRGLYFLNILKIWDILSGMVGPPSPLSNPVSARLKIDWRIVIIYRCTFIDK